MKNDDGTYDKPDYAVSAWWRCENAYAVYRVWHDGRVQTANGDERPPAIADGRWMPITLPTFPPKPLEFVAGNKYAQRNGAAMTAIGTMTNGIPVFESSSGGLVTRRTDGKCYDDRKSEYDIIAEWSEPKPRVKVPRLFTAKHRGKEVRGCYFPRETVFRHDHVYPDEYGTLWCEPSQLTDIVYTTPEYEDEL